MADPVLLLGLKLTLVLSAAIAAVLVFRPLARFLGGPQAQYLLWVAVPLCVLAALLPAPPVSMALAPPEVSDAVRGLPWKATQPFRAPRVDGELPAPFAPAPWLMGAWSGGGLFLGFLALRQHRRWRRQLQWDSLQGRWTLPAGHSPSVVGALRPQLALPEDFEARFAPAEQRLILAHEGVHARRRDVLWNGLATLFCLLNWFNPLAWWGLRRFQRDQELACDAVALHELPSDARRPYWDALLKAHDLSPSSALARGWRSAHPLIERLRAVQQGQRRARWIALMLAPAFALGLAGTVYAMYGAGVGRFGTEQTHRGNPPAVRLDIRTQIDGGIWIEEPVFLGSFRGPRQRQTVEMTHSNGERVPIFGMKIGFEQNERDIEQNERDAMEAWMLIGEPRGMGASEFFDGRVELRVRPGGWERISVKTKAGHLIRAELRLTPLPPPPSSSAR